MQERKVVAATENEYLNIILNTLHPTSNDKIPDQAQVLLKLMEFYVDDSAKTFLMIPRRRRSHSDDAKTCIKILKNSRNGTLHEVINQLNTIAFIRNGGDFARLLSTFFSVYPEHLTKCSDIVKRAVLPQDVWCHQIEAWVKSIIESKHDASWNNDHELLEHLSSVIPAQLADTYADYLLGQLNKSTYETRKGLHKGWVCSALATLHTKLSLAKRDLVTRTLLSEFNTAEYDLSMIGICAALSSLQLNPKQRKELASRLYSYTVDELPKLLDLFADHHSETISHYMAKIFTSLKNLEDQYSDIPRESIINFLLKQDNAYPLRHGIMVLDKWISNDKKLEFMSRLEIHPQFMKMAPLFWKWMAADKNANTDWSRRNRFAQRLEDIKNELTKKISADSPACPQLAWLIADNTSTQFVRSEIIANMSEELSTYNRNASNDDVRKDLHQSLALLRSWANQTQVAAIAKILQSSVRINPDDSEALKISAATAAAELAEHLRPEDSKQLRDDLLGLLDGKLSKDAAKALSIYLTKIPHKQLPELMSCLMLKDNDHAQLLLAGIHEYHQEMSLPAAPALKNAM